MKLFTVLLLLFCKNVLVSSENLLIMEDKIAEIVLKAHLTFFHDQRILSYIMAKDEMEGQPYQLFKAALYDTHHFTFYDFDISNTTSNYILPGTEKGITPHSSTHSYIISSGVVFGMEDIAQNLFRQNPNTKWAIILTRRIDEKDILKFYKKYWNLYNMAFVFTVWNQYTFEFPDNLITNITYAKSKKCFLYMFNPFETHEDGTRGKLIKLDALQMKSKEDWAQIHYFYKNLMDNLYQYPLKVVLGKDDLLMESESENKFKYPDGELVMTLMEKMNFKIERLPYGAYHLGMVLDNGKAIGVTAQLEKNEIDMIGNSRLMTDLGKF